MDVDAVVEECIDKLLSVKCMRPGTEVILPAEDIAIVVKRAREVFLSQPMMLKVCLFLEDYLRCGNREANLLSYSIAYCCSPCSIYILAASMTFCDHTHAYVGTPMVLFDRGRILVQTLMQFSHHNSLQLRPFLDHMSIRISSNSPR